MDPHLELISRGLDILDDNYYVTFDTSTVPILEMGKQERDRYYLNEVQNGLITPNEYREKTGKPKVDSYLADSMLASPNFAPIGNTEEPMPKEEAMPAAPGAPGMPMPPMEGEVAPAPEGAPPIPPPNPVEEPELPDGAFPKEGEPEDIEVKRFDLEETWETKAAQDVDRWEAIFSRALERYFQRQERVVTEKVTGAKAKRLLSGGELKVENIFDIDIWNKQLQEDLGPVIEGAMLEAATTALKESDEKMDTTEEEVQEYVTSQVERAQSVNDTTRKELAAAILLAALLVGDDEVEASISAKMAMLGTSVAAVFGALLTKRLALTSEVESNAAYNAGLFFGGKRAGATNKTWITRKDTKVRAGHAVIENKTVEIADSFKSGAILRFPGDPLAPPELVINCRCLIRFGE